MQLGSHPLFQYKWNGTLHVSCLRNGLAVGVPFDLVFSRHSTAELMAPIMTMGRRGPKLAASTPALSRCQQISGRLLLDIRESMTRGVNSALSSQLLLAAALPRGANSVRPPAPAMLGQWMYQDNLRPPGILATTMANFRK